MGGACIVKPVAINRIFRVDQSPGSSDVFRGTSGTTGTNSIFRVDQGGSGKTFK
jgi:hypothetical protein